MELAEVGVGHHAPAPGRVTCGGLDPAVAADALADHAEPALPALERAAHVEHLTVSPREPAVATACPGRHVAAAAERAPCI